VARDGGLDEEEISDKEDDNAVDESIEKLTNERRERIEMRDEMRELNENEIKYCRYKNYKNVRSSKITKKLERGKSQGKMSGVEKDHLKIKQSISKKLSSISFFAQKKERKLNIRKTLRRKLSSMVVSMMNVF